jgi:hypothetical protein
MARSMSIWSFIAVFAVTAVALSWHPDVLRFSAGIALFKAGTWILFALFLGYSIYCSTRENLFVSIKKIGRLHWGRQVGIDLYIGVFVFALFILLHQGPLLIAALWIVPLLLFANLATLLYISIHIDSIAALLMQSAQATCQ